MNTEHLLDAIGLIDDDLILDAEQAAPAPRVVPLRRKLTAWAACLAVVVTLGFGITHLPHMGMKSDSASSAPAAAAPAASAPASSAPAAEAPSAPAPTAPADAEATTADRASLRVLVPVDGQILVYCPILSQEHPHGLQVDALPQGCRSAGTVAESQSGTAPHTEDGSYPGCPLWLEGEGSDSTLYLELPQGGYLVCAPCPADEGP